MATLPGPEELGDEGGRLLVLACSRAKRPDPEPLPALERYDGPLFRVYRRYLREGPAHNQPALLVLSAEHGLIRGDFPLPPYDRVMTGERAHELAADARAALARIAKELGPLSQALFCGARAYLGVLGGLDTLRMLAPSVGAAIGARGGQATALRRWLYGPENEPAPAWSTGAPVLRGVRVEMSPGEVLASARKELTRDSEGAGRFHGWYVPVGDETVAPKWLAAKLTGLTVKSFRTAEAIQLLRRLGVDVRRA